MNARSLVCRAALALAALATLAPARNADAFARAETNWNPASLPIAYRINLASAPTTIGSAGAQSAIEAGMATWAAPTCTRWSTTNAGTSTLTRGNTGDRVNTFLWISGTWPPELGDQTVTIGVTTPVWTVGAYFIDADIQFNAVGFRWSMTGTGGTVDTQSIATHEEGHFLGLNHSTLAAAVMYASYSGGLKRTLTSDDSTGVCTIYPSGAMIPDAGTPSDPCAAYTSCAGCTPVSNCGWCAGAGRCSTGTMTGPTGGSCASGWAWQPSECTAPPPRDSGTTDPCGVNAACGTCTPVNGCGWCGASNACRSGTQTGPTGGTCASGWAWLPTECTATPGTAAFGEPCASPRDCASGGYCVSGGTGTTAFCSRSCTEDCTCPRGYHCVPTRTAGLSVCAPGANTCPPMATDSGVVADTGNPVTFDSGGVSDSGTADDVIAMTGDGGTVADAGTANPSGCRCGVVQSRASLRGFTLLALGIAGLVFRRRRRRA